MKPKQVAEVGAIAAKLGEGEPQFLVVTAKRDQAKWIFPKGHIDPGENPEDGALRELREEAGVVGTVLERVGSMSFQSGKEDVDVTYFLVRALDQEPAYEGRKLRWLSYESARQLLSFEEARKLLDRAAWLVQRRSG